MSTEYERHLLAEIGERLSRSDDLVQTAADRQWLYERLIETWGPGEGWERSIVNPPKEPAPEIIMDANGFYWRSYPEGTNGMGAPFLSLVPSTGRNVPSPEPWVYYRRLDVCPDCNYSGCIEPTCLGGHPDDGKRHGLCPTCRGEGLIPARRVDGAAPPEPERLVAHDQALRSQVAAEREAHKETMLNGVIALARAEEAEARLEAEIKKHRAARALYEADGSGIALPPYDPENPGPHVADARKSRITVANEPRDDS